MLLNCKNAFNHFYMNMVVCVWPLPSFVLTEDMVDMAHIKYSHSDITPFFLSLGSRFHVGTSPNPFLLWWKCSYLVAQSPVLWPELAVMWIAGSISSPVHPKNSSQGVSAGISVLAASLCCLSTVPPHSTPCSMDLLVPVFSWSSCKVSLRTEGFVLALLAFACACAALLIYTCS